MDKKIIIIILLIILLVISFSLLVSEKKKNTTQGAELQYTYLLLKPSETMDSELIDCKQILTFDEKDICIDSRFLYEFKDIGTAKVQYDEWKATENDENSSLKNVQIKENVVTFNALNNNGLTKTSFLEETNSNKYIEM